ncbi:MAG: mannose-1-phosphate guanylyltransferase/mannose-6-phosphate isomerase [Thermodesulfobacteriota bacterium]
MIIPVILAGGSGTRLWPLSRQLFPKQLLRLNGRRTMLQQTLERIADAGDMAEPLVICNETYRYIISEQLREIHTVPAGLILEPVGRNTAPAVAVAALKALGVDPHALILVLPADHLIRDVAAFHRALAAGARYARRGYLITFGVIPEAAETGYGYIRKGEAIAAGDDAETEPSAHVIGEFVEKPDRQTAEQYLQSGQYCWNSGMFMFQADAIIDDLKRFAPDILSSCEAAYGNGNADGEAFLLDPEAFAACRSDSVDYAVMEQTERGAMIPFDAGWSDVGSWAAMWELGQKDAGGNVVTGDVLDRDNRNCLVHAESRLVAVLGQTDCVVVESPDAVLVAPRNRAQEVKTVVDALKSENRKEARKHAKSYCPWGTVTQLSADDRVVVRRIDVNAGARLDIRTPADRVLHWVVMAGSGRIVLPDQTIAAQADTSVRLAPETSVAIEADAEVPLVFAETCARQSDTAADHLDAGAPRGNGAKT